MGHKLEIGADVLVFKSVGMARTRLVREWAVRVIAARGRGREPVRTLDQCRTIRPVCQTPCGSTRCQASHHPCFPPPVSIDSDADNYEKASRRPSSIFALQHNIRRPFPETRAVAELSTYTPRLRTEHETGIRRTRRRLCRTCCQWCSFFYYPFPEI